MTLQKSELHLMTFLKFSLSIISVFGSCGMLNDRKKLGLVNAVALDRDCEVLNGLIWMLFPGILLCSANHNQLW